MTKKNVLLISGIISLALIFVNAIGTFRLCGGREYGICMDVVFNIIEILLPIIPLFIFSLITFKMQDKIFQAWWKFARIWVPLSMLAILISPSYTHNWMFPIEKGTVSFFSSTLFIIASTILIAHQSYKSRKN
ncbi:MAG: hypothetical protein HGA36_04545 [Candidatus Moranbacteria bacterium]|nr:hypothetical protein [Candidatus Moranbacteria bacterium]